MAECKGTFTAVLHPGTGVGGGNTGTLVINSATGDINVQTSDPGTYTVTNTLAVTGNNCAVVTATFDITIRELPQATIAYSGNSTTIMCTSDNSTHQVTLTKLTPPFTGSYSASPAGLDITTSGFDVSPAGDIRPATSTPGTYTVTYSFFGGPTGCSNIATTTVVIEEPANKTIGVLAATICQGSSTNVTVSNVDAGTSYQLRDNSDNSLIGSPVSGTAGSTVNLSTGTLTAASTTFNVLAITTNGCTKVMTGTVTVATLEQPTAVSGGFAVTCQNVPYTLQPGEATADHFTTLSWTEDGLGSITAGASTLTPTYTPATGDIGNFVTLTLTAANGGICTPATATYTILVNPIPIVTLNSSYLCVGSTSSTVLSVTAPGPTDGNTWQSNNLSVATVDPVTGTVTALAAGTVTFTYHDVNGGCDNTTAALTIDGSCQVVTLTQPTQLTATIAAGRTYYNLQRRINHLVCNSIRWYTTLCTEWCFTQHTGYI